MHRHDSELRDLWKRRSNLNGTEWTRLYAVVWEILIPWRPSILRSLPEDREAYVNDFFQEKVFRPDLKSLVDHAGALRDFYKNYLFTVWRAQERRPKLQGNTGLDDDTEPEIADGESASASNEVDSDSWVALRELTGKTVEEIARSARAWLDESAETWVPIYLGVNFCPDAKESVPLYKLAKKHRVANYHRKAELLGITGAFGVDYGKTLIGRWLTRDVNITLEPENIPAVHAALKILCLQALLWAEDQEKMS